MATQQPALVLDPYGADHHAEHRTLRERGPATRVDVLGVEAWSVSDPVLLKQLLTSPDVSKDSRAHWPAFAEVVTTWPLALWVAVENMFTAYGPNHRKLRRLVAPAFSARRIEAMRPAVEKTVTAIVDRLAELPAGEPVDLRQELAYPLPIAVIGHLMGVPEDQRGGFRTVVDGVFDTTLDQAEAQANAAGLYAVLDRLIATKRATPGDDMTSLLIAARDDEGDGDRLSHDELRDTLLLVISAGYETTVNVIDQAVHTLLTRPDQLALVRKGEVTWGTWWRRRCDTNRRSSICRCGTRSTTSRCRTGGPSPAGRPSSPRTPPPTGTRTGTRTPTPSTRPAPSRSTWPSATASTSAWARRWPAWR